MLLSQAGEDLLAQEAETPLADKVDLAAKAAAPT